MPINKNLVGLNFINFKNLIMFFVSEKAIILKRIAFGLFVLFCFPILLKAQTNAMKYPLWISKPETKKGMISAISFARDVIDTKSIIFAKMNARNELKILIGKTIREITLNSDSLFNTNQLFEKITVQVMSDMDEELKQTVVREIYQEREDNQYRTVVLIDYDISRFRNYLKTKILDDPLLKNHLISNKLYSGLKRKIRKIGMYLKKVNAYNLNTK